MSQNFWSTDSLSCASVTRLRDLETPGMWVFLDESSVWWPPTCALLDQHIKDEGMEIELVPQQLQWQRSIMAISGHRHWSGNVKMFGISGYLQHLLLRDQEKWIFCKKETHTLMFICIRNYEHLISIIFPCKVLSLDPQAWNLSILSSSWFRGGFTDAISCVV